MSNFITPSELKAYPLPVSVAQWAKVGDDQLVTVIGHASDHLEDYMDRKILPANYTDRRRGTGLYFMNLQNYPVTALSSAYAYNGLGGDPTPWDTSEFYIYGDAGSIEFLNRGRHKFYTDVTWIFNYTAGFTEVPGPIKHATALQVVKMLQPLFRGGAQFVETELIADIDEQVMEMLDYYKRRRAG